jgi:4-amino-4-deoxy-L-arabinose transferase-like glycosyltransferase
MFSKTWLIKNRAWIVCIGIILLAIFLRFWQLGRIPEGFHSDEAAYGYNAYSILKTGKDEYGKAFPLVLRSYGDYKAAVDSYLAIPFIYFGGLHEWAVRAPSAVFGILFILLTYALVLRITKDRPLALISTVIATISPVGILLSRVQSDPLICATFFFFALYCWFRWLDTRKTRFIFLIGVSIFLSFYTYTITRLFAIPFFIVLGLWYWRAFDTQARIVFCGILTAVVIAVIGLYVSPAGVYFSQVSVFSSKDVQLPLDEEIREDGAQAVPLLMTRIIHNKVVAYGQYFLKNYTDYFSFEFLFTQAKEPLREQIPHQGVLMLIDLPFLLAGIYMVFRKRLSYGMFLLSWFLLAPAVLSITSVETPNVHRFILAVIPAYVLTALGILSVYTMVKPKLRMTLAAVIFCLFTINLIYDMHELFVHQPIHTPLYRNEEDKKLALYFKPVASKYDVIVSPKILEEILFFWPIDPAVYQREGSPRDTDNAWYRNFLFVNDNCPSLLLNPAVAAVKATRILYVDRPICPLAGDDVIISKIKYGNTLDAYYLIEKRTIAHK